MLTQSLIGAAALTASLFVAPVYGFAQGADIGKQEYMANCASCHGEDGKGHGPVAGFLKAKVADLTVLAQNSGGVFPFARVYDVIDGRQVVATHGPRDMPVWGKEYSQQGEKHSYGLATPEEVNSFARGRIIALIGYLSSLQAK
jgi:mono/diheme cytochrome c family protein